MWYSNTDYQDITPGTTWEPETGEVCPGRGATGALDLASGYCLACDACFDCAQPYGECLCWEPTIGSHCAHTADIDADGEGDEIPGALLWCRRIIRPARRCRDNERCDHVAAHRGHLPPNTPDGVPARQRGVSQCA